MEKWDTFRELGSNILAGNFVDFFEQAYFIQV